MYNVKSLLLNSRFPGIRRDRLTTLQMNLGYLCNLSCTHCHVNAGPKRTELMSKAVMQSALEFAEKHRLQILDVTGGSPEMNPEFRWLVRAAKEQGLHIIDRCNPTILVEPGYEWTTEFLAENRVEVIASLPCYLQENVDAQRGKGAFVGSIEGLKKLNALGYGKPESGLTLNLVFNLQGAVLPPPQEKLEADYRRYLADYFDIRFNRLFALANMPIQRFGAVLIANGKHEERYNVVFDNYLALLKNAHKPENLRHVMCKSLISVDWQGYVYDCDFNQMLHLPLGGGGTVHISDLTEINIENSPISVADHCFGCTAGQGSSCTGALSE
ncbi:MAG: arsenosugar biosynthesis radical SAM protein ArsS [Methylococcaceae bacterium]|nr:arsenosugar biosynthesis radical SAM protein ArsS [Methylococcaceae bacterium]